MSCEQEMCQYWSGDGCICKVLGIEPEDDIPCTWCLEDDCRGGCLL